MKATMPVTVEVPEHYVQLDEQGAQNYYRARQRKALLEREVINPFENALRDYTGFSDENPPKEATEVGCDLGDARFVMKCIPTKKRPSYEAVFSDLRTYLENARESFNMAALWVAWRPKGKKGLYIPLHAVERKIEGKQNEVESEGVKIEIATEGAPESVLGDAKALPVPLNGSATVLNEGNARLYLGAKELAELYKTIISGFENALVGLTGYGSKHVPEETMHHWESLGGHLFHVPSIPYPSTSYGKVMSRLTNEDENVKKAGDLVLLRRGMKVARLRKYDARRRRAEKPEDRLFISVDGTLDCLEKIREEETKVKVRQKPIEHYPLV